MLKNVHAFLEEKKKKKTQKTLTQYNSAALPDLGAYIK